MSIYLYVYLSICLRTWNDIHNEIKGAMLNKFSLVKLKSLLIEFYMNMYKIS